MFGISGVELVIILLFAFLIVGPDKLPDAAKTIGKAIAKFQDAQTQMNDVIKTESETIKSEVMSAVETQQKTTRTVTKAPEPTAAAATASPAEPAEDDPKPAARTMSFSERKAQYEKERAAKRKAEEEAAKAAAAAEKEGE